VADSPHVAVIGVSIERIDGVRDPAAILADTLQANGVSCSLHWLARVGPPASRYSYMQDWARALPDDVHDAGADALLLHYSAFSFYYRGLPIFLHPTVAALRRCGVPLVTFLHELVYPWLTGGVRGMVWAVADRASLRELVGASSATIVTTDSCLRWVGSRWWLPTRPLSLAPVFSNLPPPTIEPSVDRALPVVGIFGY
jgi:hypothetical protein